LWRGRLLARLLVVVLALVLALPLAWLLLLLAWLLLRAEEATWLLQLPQVCCWLLEPLLQVLPPAVLLRPRAELCGVHVKKVW